MVTITRQFDRTNLGTVSIIGDFVLFLATLTGKFAEW